MKKRIFCFLDVSLRNRVEITLGIETRIYEIAETQIVRVLKLRQSWNIPTKDVLILI